MRSFDFTSPWFTTIVALIAIGMLGVAGRAIAQTIPPRPNFDAMRVPGSTPVAVAVTDNMARPDFNIVIQRRATAKPQDVILVRPTALQPELLAQAIETLQATRRKFGRIPSQDMLITVASPGSSKPPRAGEAVGWVKSLQAVKPMELPGVGVVRMIVLHPFDRELANNP